MIYRNTYKIHKHSRYKVHWHLLSRMLFFDQKSPIHLLLFWWSISNPTWNSWHLAEDQTTLVCILKEKMDPAFITQIIKPLGKRGKQETNHSSDIQVLLYFILTGSVSAALLPSPTTPGGCFLLLFMEIEAGPKRPWRLVSSLHMSEASAINLNLNLPRRNWGFIW